MRTICKTTETHTVQASWQAKRTNRLHSKVRVAGGHKELIGDVRNVVTGFLKNNCMELSTGSGDNVDGVPARQSWIPLKNRETVLMMHEITVV